MRKWWSKAKCFCSWKSEVRGVHPMAFGTQSRRTNLGRFLAYNNKKHYLACPKRALKISASPTLMPCQIPIRTGTIAANSPDNGWARHWHCTLHGILAENPVFPSEIFEIIFKDICARNTIWKQMTQQNGFSSMPPVAWKTSSFSGWLNHFKESKPLLSGLNWKRCKTRAFSSWFYANLVQSRTREGQNEFMMRCAREQRMWPKYCLKMRKAQNQRGYFLRVAMWRTWAENCGLVLVKFFKSRKVEHHYKFGNAIAFRSYSTTSHRNTETIARGRTFDWGCLVVNIHFFIFDIY